MLPEINKYHDEKGRIFIGIIWILLILLVPLARVERAAHGLGIRCSILLSYRGDLVSQDYSRFNMV